MAYDSKPKDAYSTVGTRLGRTRRKQTGLRISINVRIWGLSKHAARYGVAPAADVRCDRCAYMFPPFALGGCRLVRGVIRGSATCDQFRARKRS